MLEARALRQGLGNQTQWPCTLLELLADRLRQSSRHPSGGKGRILVESAWIDLKMYDI
jgi:hypothetical protein